tara:strand:- start:171 stop:533 length:363 start_codon:yes stop_codon:yes gene_type:complete
MTKQALLIIDHGSKKQEANLMLFDVVKALQKRRPDLIIEGAHMELASPTIEDGINQCIQKGAQHIIAQPFMLSPGRHTTEDIPNMVQKIAQKHPNVQIKTTKHFGLHEKIIDILLDAIKL